MGETLTVSAYAQGKAAILDAFSVKGYKSWTAREGVGAQTILYKDGKKFGWCTDEGNGGEVGFRGYTVEAEKMVWEFVKSLPKYWFTDMWRERFNQEWDGAEHSKLESWNVHEFADVMLSQAEEQSELRKACRTKTLIRLEGDAPQEMRVYDVKWPKDTYAQMQIGSRLTKQLLPKVIVEIVNKRFD